MCVCACVHACVSACMHVCMRVCVYVCMFTEFISCVPQNFTLMLSWQWGNFPYLSSSFAWPRACGNWQALVQSSVMFPTLTQRIKDKKRKKAESVQVLNCTQRQGSTGQGQVTVQTVKRIVECLKRHGHVMLYQSCCTETCWCFFPRWECVGGQAAASPQQC